MEASDSVNEQVQREERAHKLATSTALKEFEEAVRNGNPDRVRSVQVLTRRIIPLIVDYFEAVKPAQGKTGRGALVWIKELDSETLAALSLRIVLSRCMDTRPATAQSICIALGRYVWTEVITRQAMGADAQYMQRISEYLQGAYVTNTEHYSSKMRRAAAHVLGDENTEGLSNTKLLQIGKHGLQACLDAGVVTQVRKYAQKGLEVTYELTDEVSDFILEYGERMCSMVAPTHEAMVAPPRTWSDKQWGGYYTATAMAHAPLTHTRNWKTSKAAMREFRDSPEVLDVVNYLQGQEFKLHAPAVQLVQSCWEAGGNVLGLPSPRPTGKPEFPFPETWLRESASAEEVERFRDWKLETHFWYTRELERKAQALRIVRLLGSMRELSGRSIWHPVFCDWRGRFYYFGSVNPQGSDEIKSCYHFAEKKALGKRGLFWLKVHIANCFGEDKEDFPARAQWTEQNWEELLAGCESPQDSDLYRACEDYPFSAAVAVQELRNAYKLSRPEEYETGIPIHMDATCSGLQMFAGLLKDETTALAVNVKDAKGTAKADIYMRVASEMQALAEADLGGDNDTYAKALLDVGIERAYAKKPTMTFVYGCTFKSVTDHGVEYIKARTDRYNACVGRLAGYMSRIFFAAVAAVVPAATACMQWLRGAARMQEPDAPLEWQAPMGVIISQMYFDQEEKRVNIRSCGLKSILLREDLPTSHKSRMENGASPNFVHSLDASLLAFTARRMQEQGKSLVTIHDSFGTHPTDVDALHAAVREAYVEMFTEHNPLLDIAKSAGLPAESIPPQGNLDVRDVLQSRFFFC